MSYIVSHDNRSYNVTHNNPEGYLIEEVDISFSPIGTDLFAWYNERSASTLIDAKGGDAAQLELPTTYVPGAYFDSEIIPDANTLWIIKGSHAELQLPRLQGADSDAGGDFAFGKSIGGKWSLSWGSGNAQSIQDADTDFHTFIVYDGKLWISDPAMVLTDENILDVINNDIPEINVSEPWVAADRSLWYARLNAAYVLYEAFEYCESLIGSLDGTITWQRNYVFTDPITAHDIINQANSKPWLNSGNIQLKRYSIYGSTRCLDDGHTLFERRTDTDYISVPYINGSPVDSVSLNPGYLKIGDFAGDSESINFADCNIIYPLDFFDRSNVTIWNDNARNAITHYDALNPRTFHISEHNYRKLFIYLNDNYKKLFARTSTGSLEVYGWEKLTEILLYSTNKTGSNFDTVLEYTGDLAQWKDYLFGSVEDIEVFGNYPNQYKWIGAILADNGSIYGIPLQDNGVIKLNPVSDDRLIFSWDNGQAGGLWKWAGGTLASNGYIYCTPFSATTVLKIDPRTDTAEEIGSVSGVEGWYSGVEVNGIIYCSPYNEDTILRIDTSDDSITEIQLPDIFGITGIIHKYSDPHLAANGYVYFTPMSSFQTMRLDPSDDSLLFYGGTLTASNKCIASVITPEGIIYGMPYNHDWIYKFDTNTHTQTIINTAIPALVEKYGACEIGNNGIIYGLPYREDNIIRFDPSNETYTTFGVITGDYKFYGSAITPEGVIYAFPESVESFEIIKLFTEDI